MTTMSLTTPAKTTSHTERDESKAIYAAGTRDRDAPIVLVVSRMWLVAMTGKCQQVQHLHEIATKDSRPAVQKTVLKIKRSGTILRRNQQPHRPQRRTTAASTPIASKHAQGRSEPERDSHPINNNTSMTTLRQQQYQRRIPRREQRRRRPCH